MNKPPFTMLMVLSAALLYAQGSSSASHLDHHAAMNHRGAEAMGFDQEKVTHHFLLTPNGGVIQVSAKGAQDNTTISQIQEHLVMQAQRFAAGDFGAPEHTHAQVPPGVAIMKELRKDIHYRFQKTDDGGKLTIASSDSKAVGAVHDFLRFQIKEHETGDSGKIQ